MFVIYDLQGGGILDGFHGYVETESEAKQYIRNKELAGEGRYLHYSEVFKASQIPNPKKIAVSVHMTVNLKRSEENDKILIADLVRFIPLSKFEKEGEFPYIDIEKKYIISRINLLLDSKDYTSTDEAMKEKCRSLAEQKCEEKYLYDQNYRKDIDDEIKKNLEIINEKIERIYVK